MYQAVPQLVSISITYLHTIILLFIHMRLFVSLVDLARSGQEYTAMDLDILKL